MLTWRYIRCMLFTFTAFRAQQVFVIIGATVTINTGIEPSSGVCDALRPRRYCNFTIPELKTTQLCRQGFMEGCCYIPTITNSCRWSSCVNTRFYSWMGRPEPFAREPIHLISLVRA
ncbi:hypothetical protein GGR57DRAFT_459434 [Xylariaceae sp. FL1272]|nr:hypothetical protein GGR57DRAFT_459434 [Xylariaceae sp. FL1272]